MNLTSSWSKAGRWSAVKRPMISSLSFSTLMPDHVCSGSANRSIVRTSPVEGCMPVQLPWSMAHKLLGPGRGDGTSISTPCSEPLVVTVPDTTVIGLSPSPSKSLTSVCLQQKLSTEQSFPAKIWAPWQQTSAAISGNALLSPEDLVSLQRELSQVNHLDTCLKSSVSCTSFKTSSWKAQSLTFRIRLRHLVQTK